MPTELRYDGKTIAQWEQQTLEPGQSNYQALQALGQLAAFDPDAEAALVRLMQEGEDPGAAVGAALQLARRGAQPAAVADAAARRWGGHASWTVILHDWARAPLDPEGEAYQSAVRHGVELAASDDPKAKRIAAQLLEAAAAAATDPRAEEALQRLSDTPDPDTAAYATLGLLRMQLRERSPNAIGTARLLMGALSRTNPPWAHNSMHALARRMQDALMAHPGGTDVARTLALLLSPDADPNVAAWATLALSCTAREGDRPADHPAPKLALLWDDPREAVQGVARLRLKVLLDEGEVATAVVAVNPDVVREKVAALPSAFPYGTGHEKYVRNRIVDGVSGLGPVAAPLLIERLGTADAGGSMPTTAEKHVAAWALARLGEGAREPLTQAIQNHPDENTRLMAVETWVTLVEAGYHRGDVAGPLNVALRQGNPAVRAAAARWTVLMQPDYIFGHPQPDRLVLPEMLPALLDAIRGETDGERVGFIVDQTLALLTKLPPDSPEVRNTVLDLLARQRPEVRNHTLIGLQSAKPALVQAHRPADAPGSPGHARDRQALRARRAARGGLPVPRHDRPRPRRG